MDEGCLIHFENLEIGDVLFDILRGKVFVSEIGQSDEEYPITCEKINTNGDEEEYTYTIDGKEYSSEVYPKIYKKDPFKYAFQIAREKSKENQILCQKVKILEMTLVKFGKTKDV